MDTSNGELLDIWAVLRRNLSTRKDAYWELIATAAGDEESLEKTLVGLSSAQLDKGGSGLAVSPSIVRDRVEALSVSGLEQLLAIVCDWRNPSTINGDPFWVACWQTALRHLVTSGAVDLNETRRVPELRKESDLLSTITSNARLSWAELRRRSEGIMVTTDIIRDWSRFSLTDKVLTREDIKSTPTLLLRVLRDKPVILNRSAQDWILGLCDDLLGHDPYEAAIMLEIGRGYDPELEIRLARLFLDKLPAIHEPRDLIPLVYMCINRQWLVA